MFPSRFPFIASLVSIFLVGSLAQAQPQRYDIHTMPTGDGYLVDKSDPWDNVPDEADALSQVAHAGSYFGNEYVAIFEFSLPPESVVSGLSLYKANLTLFTHQKGLSPADIEIFAYYGESADGVANVKDWSAGDSIGEFLVEGESEISVLNRCPVLNVTDVVEEALDAGANFIGFRLRAVDPVQTRTRTEYKGVIFRLAEFGMKHEQYRPTLSLDFRK